MKNFIIFYRDGDHYYTRRIEGAALSPLASLIGTDVRNHGVRYSLQCTEADGVETNADATFIETHDGIMTVGDLLDKHDKSVPKFSLPREQFRNLLLAWEAAVRNKPKEIIITKDGDNVTLETRD